MIRWWLSRAPRSLATWCLGTYDQFKPINAWQDWLVQQIALIKFRVNRVQRVERRLRDLMALRAIDFWEEDQRLAIETLALKITKEPGKTVSLLMTTPAGCDWLIERWEELATIGADRWNDDQRTLAYHLARGRTLPWTPALIAEWIDGLREQSERVAEADVLARTLVESDLSEDLTPELKRIRRLEKELLTRLRWFTREARIDPIDRRDDERYVPQYTVPFVEPIATPTYQASAPPGRNEPNSGVARRNEPNHRTRNRRNEPDRAGAGAGAGGDGNHRARDSSCFQPSGSTGTPDDARRTGRAPQATPRPQPADGAIR